MKSDERMIWRWVIGWFTAVLLVFMAVPILHCIRGHSIKDYIVWYDAGHAVLHGTEVYPPLNFKFPFMYPPACALFLAPLAALGKLGLITVLVFVFAASWIASIVLSVRLATGKAERAHWLLYVVPSAIVIVYVWGNFLLGQPSILLLALLLGAFFLLQRNRQIGAGVFVALAAAIKAFPVIAIVYLIYRRYWIATASLVVTLVLLIVVLPIPFRGYALAKQELSRWSNGMLFKYDEGGVGQRGGRSQSWRNQSIWGVANRMLRHVESDPAFGPHVPVYSNITDLGFKTVNRIILAAALLFGLAYVAVMPRRNRRTTETDAIEFALLLLLILMFTPLTFGYLFVWLLYPFTVSTQRLLTHRNPRLFVLTAAAVVLLSLTAIWRVPAQTYGNVFFATTLLFVALALELWTIKRAPFAERAVATPR
ncbi:MAG: glycosyltransferase family 87 protein [Chthoniobacterales bacterium]